MKQSYLIIYNSITNYGRALIQGIVSFFLVPFIVGHIGTDSYGIVLLAIAAYGMVELFGVGLGKAVIKFFAQERANKKVDLLNVIYNSSLLWFFIVGFVGSIVVLLIGFFFENIFVNVSDKLIDDGRLSMFILSVTILPCIVLDVFKGILSGEQRYDLVNFFGTFAAVLRAIFIVIYFYTFPPSLIAVVIIYSTFYIIERLCYLIASYRIIDNLILSFSYLNKKGINLIIGFASMMLIATMANMLAGHVFKFIIGIELTLTDLTYYGILLLLTSTASLLVRSFVNVLVPVASKYEALGDSSILQKLYLHGTKYAVIIILGLTYITLPFLKNLLGIWMGEQFKHIWFVGLIMFVGQILNSSSVTAKQILSGLGQVKILAISSTFSVVIGLGSCFLYLDLWEGALLSIAVLLLTSQSVINTIIIIKFSIKYIKIKMNYFLIKAYLIPLIISSFVLLLGLVLNYLIKINTWPLLILNVIFIEVIYYILVYRYALDSEEKSLFINILNKGLKKIYSLKSK